MRVASSAAGAFSTLFLSARGFADRWWGERKQKRVHKHNDKTIKNKRTS
jgi:hypothetical protein